MSKAKKLPSGSWRCQASYKGLRRSFTASTKKEAEYMAAEWRMMAERAEMPCTWTLGEAIDHYIEEKEPVLSPSTIQGYRKTRRTAFLDLMDIPIDKITSADLNAAIRAEMRRKPANRRTATISPKTICNNYGLISSTLAKYLPDRTYHVDLPKRARRIRTLPEPVEIYRAVVGTNSELPVLLAMWLSLSLSEIKGLTKSKSIDGDYLTIREVVILVDGVEVRKDIGKTVTRNRRLKMPERIKTLIEQVDGDVICPESGDRIRKRFQSRIRAAGLPEMSFHDLRHENASVMAALQIPEKIMQDRGGWSSSHIMKSVYVETFDAERMRADSIIDRYFETFI